METEVTAVCFCAVTVRVQSALPGRSRRGVLRCVCRRLDFGRRAAILRRPCNPRRQRTTGPGRSGNPPGPSLAPLRLQSVSRGGRHDDCARAAGPFGWQAAATPGPDSCLTPGAASAHHRGRGGLQRRLRRQLAQRPLKRPADDQPRLAAEVRPGRQQVRAGGAMGCAGRASNDRAGLESVASEPPVHWSGWLIIQPGHALQPPPGRRAALPGS